jgi:DNA helicase II / ATP-dependent DNA helicase PcrA
MDAERILAGLNDAQRKAAVAVRGPVAILAGAGTGKTTTITARIAFQVASGTFRPGQILAVTFTDKAAGELQRRLSSLGVEGGRRARSIRPRCRSWRGCGPRTPASRCPTCSITRHR